MVTRITMFDSMREDRQSSAEIGGPAQDRMALDPTCRPTATLIQTANSIYLFRVNGPCGRRGQLVGGAVGEGPVNAVLVGTLTDGDDPTDGASRLRIGSRAVFDVECERAWKRVVTSRVIDLTQAEAS